VCRREKGKTLGNPPQGDPLQDGAAEPESHESGLARPAAWDGRAREPKHGIRLVGCSMRQAHPQPFLEMRGDHGKLSFSDTGCRGRNHCPLELSSRIPCAKLRGRNKDEPYSKKETTTNKGRDAVLRNNPAGNVSGVEGRVQGSVYRDFCSIWPVWDLLEAANQDNIPG
jgi:hypothetical protein